MTIQEILKPYGVQDYGGFLRSTKGILSGARANQIWYRKGGIGRRKARELHDKLGWPYALLLAAEPGNSKRKRG